MFLYGASKTGKSTLASTFPKPLFLLIGETKRDFMDNTVRFSNLSELSDFIKNDLPKYLSKSSGPKTVVIDSLQHIELLVNKYICEKFGIELLGDTKQMGKEYGQAKSLFKNVIADIQNVCVDVNIVWIAHETSYDKSEDVRKKSAFSSECNPNINKDIASFIESLCDITCAITYEETKKSKVRKIQLVRDGIYHYSSALNWLEDVTEIVDPTYDKLTEGATPKKAKQ